MISLIDYCQLRCTPLLRLNPHLLREDGGVQANPVQKTATSKFLGDSR